LGIRACAVRERSYRPAGCIQDAQQIRSPVARGCALRRNYVETAVQQTGWGASFVAPGRIGSPGFLGYDAQQGFL